LTGIKKELRYLIAVNKVINIEDKIYFYHREVPSSNTTLVKGNINILIDPGYNPIWKTKSLELLMKEAKIEIKDIDEIWFTHNHPDHTGLAYYLLQEKEMKIVCHPLAKDFLNIEPPIRGLLEKEKIDDLIIEKLYPAKSKKRGRIKTFAGCIVKFYGSFLSIGSHAIIADDCFSDGELRNEIKVIFLPGHTNDEVGFFLGNILITGDLIATFSFKRPAVLNVPSSDIDEAISSLKKILEISPELILPGHGNCSKIDLNLVKEIYNQTVNLREKGISLINKTHSFIPYFLGMQRILPLFTLRIQERLALLYIIYKSYIKSVRTESNFTR
jgi:glyoxylase-like metal-dependent hydrolase (beta-lactamase superfamily II)